MTFAKKVIADFEPTIRVPAGNFLTLSLNPDLMAIEKKADGLTRVLTTSCTTTI